MHILIGVVLFTLLIVLSVVLREKRKPLSKHTPFIYAEDWDSTKWKWVK